MAEFGGLKLLGSAASTLVRIGTDRITRFGGRGLPQTSEALARPDTLASILEASSAMPRRTWPGIQDVRLPGVDFESSNCRNFLIEVDWADGADGADAKLPRTMYAKLPCEELPTRVFGHAIGFWPLECYFCEHVARHIPIRVPEVYAVATRGTRFVLLLENLLELPGIRLFINRDMAEGTTLERAERCLSAFAELHAAFWGANETDREALLPLAFHTHLSPSRTAVTRSLNALAIPRARRAAPELFSGKLAESCEEAIGKWDRMTAAWYSGPLTLVHGDSHLGNCFEYADPDGGTAPRVGMLDFQAVHWASGIRDVQYFLINSLEPDLLADHEDALIEHYCAELARHGVTFEQSDARVLYRAYAFQTLMTAVVPLGLDSLTERNETVLTILRRSTAAAHRLDLRGWIMDL